MLGNQLAAALKQSKGKVSARMLCPNDAVWIYAEKTDLIAWAKKYGSSETGDSDLQSVYAAWDAWIVPEIAQRYGVELSTTISMVDLFNRISLSKAALAPGANG